MCFPSSSTCVFALPLVGLGIGGDQVVRVAVCTSPGQVGILTVCQYPRWIWYLTVCHTKWRQVELCIQLAGPAVGDVLSAGGYSLL